MTLEDLNITSGTTIIFHKEAMEMTNLTRPSYVGGTGIHHYWVKPENKKGKPLVQGKF